MLELPNKELLRVDEVANFFSVSDRCIRLWIAHGHLTAEKIVGSVRVTRDSVLKCRIGNKANTDKENIDPEPDISKVTTKRGRPKTVDIMRI